MKSIGEEDLSDGWLGIDNGLDVESKILDADHLLFGGVFVLHNMFLESEQLVIKELHVLDFEEFLLVDVVETEHLFVQVHQHSLALGLLLLLSQLPFPLR